MLQDDNTYETQSRISFVASRFENGEFITCESNNQVIVDHQEEPHRASITLQVLCKYKQGPVNYPKRLNYWTITICASRESDQVTLWHCSFFE